MMFSVGSDVSGETSSRVNAVGALEVAMDEPLKGGVFGRCARPKSMLVVPEPCCCVSWAFDVGVHGDDFVLSVLVVFCCLFWAGLPDRLGML